MQLKLLLLYLSAILQLVKGSYHFEIRFYSYKNPNNNNWKGKCCDCCRSGCGNPCDVIFYICLQEPNTGNSCNLGSRNTLDQPISGPSIYFTGTHIGSLTNPVTFNGYAWPGNVQLNVRMEDADSISRDDFIDRVIINRYFEVSNWFTPLESVVGIHRRVTLLLSFRLTCDENYYGSDCTTYCVSQFSYRPGGYFCNSDGDRVCSGPYTGIRCLTPICADGCFHGFCTAPGLCDVCDYGWSGSLCNQCELAAGCYADRAYCRQAGQCICIMGYSGALCQIDEDVCGHQTPCRNGGTCTNTGSDKYFCQCSVGYKGHNCDVDIDQCVSSPCLNAATCHDLDGPATFECSCATGWTGSLCDDNLNECSLSLPCQNNGTCADCVPSLTQLGHPQTLPYCPLGYNCTCMAGHYGDNCEADVDYCISAPCQNGGSCVDIIGGPGYTCTCPLEYTGLDCDVEFNECESSPCLNGGNCTDLVGSYSCDCELGFTGETCSTNIDECASSPCHPNNTLECRDEINSFLCICLPGYTGSNCSLEVDECEVFPCANGGTCTAMVNNFDCQCPLGFNGTRCEINVDNCNPDICQFGGTCVDQVDDYTCLCAPAYTGTQCETTLDLCTSSPCDTNQFCRQNITMDQGFECFSCVAGEAGCALIISGNDKMTVGVVVGVTTAIVLLMGVVIIVFCLIKKCHCSAGVKEREIDMHHDGAVQNNPLYFGTSTVLSNLGTSFGGSHPGQIPSHITLGGDASTENEDYDYMAPATLDAGFTASLQQSNQCNKFEEEHVYNLINFPGQNKHAETQKREVSHTTFTCDDDELNKMNPNYSWDNL